MIRYVTNPFRDAGLGTPENLQDFVSFDGSPAFTAGRSKGATLIDAISFPGISSHEKWAIQAASVQCQISTVAATGDGSALGFYGLLGRLLMALIPQNGQPTQLGGIAFTTPMLPLPDDSSLTNILWDGSEDDISILHANVAATASTTWLSGEVTLPVPRQLRTEDLQGGNKPVIGLWLTPSLVGISKAAPALTEIQINVTSARYTVTYDDGNY